MCFVGFIELEILKEVEVEGFRCLSKNNQSFGFMIWVKDGIIKCRALSKNSSVKINLKFHYFKKTFSHERIIIIKKTSIDSICSTCRIIKFSQLLYQKYQFEETKPFSQTWTPSHHHTKHSNNSGNLTFFFLHSEYRAIKEFLSTPTSPHTHRSIESEEEERWTVQARESRRF